jgi:hypothetical protein
MMGMDVTGRNPKADVGVYFRRSVWGWNPLATLVIKVAPDITRHCKRWYTNDGDGLNATNAARLAAALNTALASGKAAMLVALRAARLRRLPDEACTWCDGTGVRSDEVGREYGLDRRTIDDVGHPRHGQTGWCNGCDGRGSNRPSDTKYRVSEADVREFADFVNNSGGFRIG